MFERATDDFAKRLEWVSAASRVCGDGRFDLRGNKPSINSDGILQDWLSIDLIPI